MQIHPQNLIIHTTNGVYYGVGILYNYVMWTVRYDYLLVISSWDTVAFIGSDL